MRPREPETTRVKDRLPPSPSGPGEGQPQAILSIHDLMPDTLPRVLGIVELLRDEGAPPATLLVVPGRRWSGESLAWLRRLEEEGYPLAAHGWEHSAPRPRTLWHRLHARLISRDQGEHLSRSRAELVEMVRRSAAWFDEVGLIRPGLYVPPAWALGALTRTDLVDLPFRRYEVLPGLIDGETGRLHLLPLAGFEADTRTRKRSLRVFNRLNVSLALRTGRPLRISIHPFDLGHLLSRDLVGLIRGGWRFVGEDAALGRS